MCKHNKIILSVIIFLYILFMGALASVIVAFIKAASSCENGSIMLCTYIVSFAAVAITVVICLTVFICLTLKYLHKKDEKIDECVKVLKEAYEKIFNNANIGKKRRNHPSLPQKTNE